MYKTPYMQKTKGSKEEADRLYNDMNQLLNDLKNVKKVESLNKSSPGREQEDLNNLKE